MIVVCNPVLQPRIFRNIDVVAILGQLEAKQVTIGQKCPGGP